MDKELRRCRSDLSLLGSGIIVFTIWELVKSMLIAVLAPETESAGQEAEAVPEVLEELSSSMISLLAAAILLLLFFSVVFRLYIGFSARAEAAGKRKGKLYVVLAFVFFAGQLLMFVLGLIQLILNGIGDNSITVTLVTQIVETTSLVITGELAFTAVKFKKLNRRKAEQAGS